MQDLFAKAEDLFAQGKLEQARACFLDVVNTDRENKEAFNNLGVIEFKLDNLEDALRHVSSALALDPEYRDAHDNLVVIQNAIDQRAAEKSRREELQPPAQTKPVWQFPPQSFSANPVERLNALVEEGNKQIEAGRFDLAEISFWRVAMMTRYENRELLETMAGIFQQSDNIPGIKEVWKRAAAAALESNRLDDFLEYNYISIYSEHLFGKNPNYEFTSVDEDINAFIRIAAKTHPLYQSNLQKRKSTIAEGKLRVGFVTEGLSQFQASVRTYYPLTEYHNRDKYEIYVYSRWWHGEEIAKQHKYDTSAEQLSSWGAKVRTPQQRLSPMAQVEFINNAIITDQIDALVYQTTYFVPGYNFLSCIHPAPFQVSIAHQQAEFSHELDLVYAFKKVPFETTTPTLPFPMAHTRKTARETYKRSDYNIPEDAVVMVSTAREMKFHQPEFWHEMEKTLRAFPKACYIPLGLPSIKDYLPAELHKQVITLGYRTDVLEILGLADIYVDTFPMGTASSVIEALQCGLAAITMEPDYATRYSVSRERVSSLWIKEPEVVIPAGDLERWHNTLGRLISDSHWRAQIAAQMLENSKLTEPQQVTRDFFEGLESAYRKKMSK